eukprot:8914606-Prorocentrum_lima.AAC.1
MEREEASKAAASSHEPASEPPLGALDFDLSALSTSSANYVVEYGGRPWIKFNYDSGAAATAIPIELAD